jgi:hypothetical protein
MAQIKYLDSRRIMGESDGTDIAPTFEDDFATDNWTDSDSAKMGVQSGYLYAYGQRDGSNDSSSRSLGTTLNGDFVFRTKVDITSWSAGAVGYGKGVIIGLSDQSNTASDSTAQDSIAISISARQTNGDGFYAIWSDNQGMTSGSSTRIGSLAISTGIRYFEIIKNGTTVTYNIYSDNLYSTLVATASQTSVTATGFTYAVVRNENGTASTQSGYVEADIDDWEVFSGVTSVTAGKPSLTPAVTGGWVELGRTTLGSASSTIDVTSLSNKRYYMVLVNNKGRSAVSDNGFLRMGNGSFDTTTSYANRRSANGAGDTTQVTQNKMYGIFAPTNTTDFYVGYIANKSDKEKLLIAHQVNQNSTGVAPTRNETVHKHVFTSNPIDQISFLTDNSDTYNTGSEVVVLGWDPSDTHTTNFWEELANVTASGSSTNLSSGTFTAKKYLWVQIYQEGTSADLSMNFNNDTSTNYFDRYNINNAEGTRTSQTKFQNWLHQGYGGQSSFINMFILNNSSDDKLVIAHSVSRGAGSDATTIPRRGEWVGKWVNSNQITEIETDSQTSNFGANSFIKVWGSD